MNNQFVMELFFFFQLMNLGILFLEQDKIMDEWKGWTIKTKIGRAFFLFMPSLVVLSLHYNPL